MSANIVVLDVERVPMWTKQLPVWDMRGLMNRRLTPGDIAEWGRTICMAYRTLGKPVQFTAEWHDGGREAFIRQTWDVFNEADVIVGHNSKAFDTKHLQGEWALLGLGPASPVKHFDTLVEARKHFNFEANHLDTLTKRFGIVAKNDKYRIDTAMAAVGGDVKAQKRIERYNRGDVRASTGLYLYLRAWGNVNLGLYRDDDRPVCPACESPRMQRRGYAVKQALKYPQYQCQACGKWMTSKKAVSTASVEMRPA